MDEELKKGLKKMAKNAELKVAESLLRWKYKKEGKRVPDDESIGQQTRTITDQAHQIIAKRGKRFWKGFKEAYEKAKKEEDSTD
ncbi:MAG: hypothetical protein HKM90_06125 [Desulfobacteraceae bacterium]|nr:hypothetical protein [Desulfobacteraceae bacterium]